MDSRGTNLRRSRKRAPRSRRRIHRRWKKTSGPRTRCANGSRTTTGKASTSPWPTWKGVRYDLLAENNIISFHRFQIFVWTLILGIIFVANVYNELAMPEFSATLLGLLGISAGPDVGFKLPEQKAQ